MIDDWVAVTYRDPFFELDSSEAPVPCINTVLGFKLARVLDGHVSIAAERTGLGDYRAVTHIPLEAVITCRPLELRSEP